MTTAALLSCGSNWGTYLKTVSPFLVAGSSAWAIAYGAQTGLSTKPMLSALAAAVTFVAIYGVGLFIVWVWLIGRLSVMRAVWSSTVITTPRLIFV